MLSERARRRLNRRGYCGRPCESRADANVREPRFVESNAHVDLALAHALRSLRCSCLVGYLTDRNAVDAASRRYLLNQMPCLVLGDDGTFSLSW